jgi:hypothetical protein
MTDLDLSRFQVFTFDCYGTLIDWESGLLAALRPVLSRHGVEAGDGELLESYARHETEVGSVVRMLRIGFPPGPRLSCSLRRAPPARRGSEGREGRAPAARRADRGLLAQVG